MTEESLAVYVTLLFLKKADKIGMELQEVWFFFTVNFPWENIP